VKLAIEKQASLVFNFFKAATVQPLMKRMHLYFLTGCAFDF
jgi:hypothetical protein